MLSPPRKGERTAPASRRLEGSSAARHSRLHRPDPGGVRPSLHRRGKSAALSGALAMQWRAPPAGPIGAVVIFLLVWLVLYPNLFVLMDSLREGAEWTTQHYARFAQSRSEREALWNSVWISAASVLFSGLIGVPLAFLFTRYDFPGRSMLGGLVALPVLLPPLVGVIAFLFLYGGSGFLA